MNKKPDPSQRKVLGKGLSALLPSRTATAAAAALAPEPVAPPVDRSTSSERLLMLPLNEIQPNQDQPRESFDPQKLDELAQSIKANGLIQPITVFRNDAGKYTIIAGERRWRAAHFAELKEVPVYVRETSNDRLLELALIENIQREDLNPVETAAAFQRLASDHGLSHEEIAERTGKDRSTITNFLRLLRLAPLVLQDLARGNITTGHARTLLNLTDPDLQFRTAQEIILKKLSVRETETLVKNLAKKPELLQTQQNKQDTKPVDPNIRAAIDEMAMALGTKVRLVARSPKAGKLEVEYYSQDDLDRIYAVIVKTA